jgi:hypothetical protein
MKTAKLKYTLLAGLAVIGITVLSVYSCEKETIQPNNEISANTERSADNLKFTLTDPSTVCGNVSEEYLITNEGKKVGKAFFWNDAHSFHLTMLTVRGFMMGGANMHIMQSPNEFPLTADQIPAIGKFEYQIDAPGFTNIREFVVPMKDLVDRNYIAATVAVRIVKSGSDEKNVDMDDVDLPDGYLRLWVNGRSQGVNRHGKIFVFDRTRCELTDDSQVSDSKGITHLDDEHIIKDEKGITSLGDGHSTTDPKKPR